MVPGRVLPPSDVLGPAAAECWGNLLLFPPWGAIEFVKSQSQACSIPVFSYVCLPFFGLLVFSLFSLLWPSPWGWEEERAPSLFFNRGPVTAPNSGLVASERAVWEPGRVALSGIATERFPAEVAEVSIFSSREPCVHILQKDRAQFRGSGIGIRDHTVFQCGSAYPSGQ